MRWVCKTLVQFAKSEDGPTAAEYAIALALIIVLCVAAITTLGPNSNSTYSPAGSSFESSTGSTGNGKHLGTGS
jgi:pilus assembly protein Flp/PilA